MTEIIAKFVWPHVDRRGPDECWPWTASANSSGAGHGVAYVGNGRSMSAHRAVYQLMVEPLTRAQVLDHVVCQNPICVNPAHCEPVTQAINVQRGRVRESNLARAAAITHCPKGHEYTPENTRMSKNKNRPGLFRQCIACSRLASARAYAKRKARPQE